MSENWDQYFIRMAQLVSSKSKDPSTKVGCVIVGPDNEVRSTGYNGFPRGVVELAESDPHYPVEMQRSFAGNEFQAVCTCGDIIPIPANDVIQRKGGFDVLPDRGDLMERIGQLIPDIEHFKKAGEIILHPERWERPLKYDYVEHAERNAVYNAARVGVPTGGCRAYLNWEPHPCKECTKAFIQAGITEVIGPNRPFSTNNDWKFDVSAIMASESGMKITQVEAAWE